jgi:glyoxylase-like metal-dependent hydrolase (beta-lactamase superfamily II)
MVKTSAPGYYRFMLGDFEVTALSDGTADLPMDSLLKGMTPAAVRQTLAKSFLKTPLESSFNAYLINTGPKLVLIDTGAGKLFGPTLGNLLANLKSSGYQPDQVDEIYITHMHPDHIGGLTLGDQLAFPNAIVRADKTEADYWLNQSNLDKAPADLKGMFQGAMGAIGPYEKAGRFKTFSVDEQLVPGIRSVATHGHTPGHDSYVVESRGQKLIVIGDLIHAAAVQFKRPDITIQFDSDPKAARAERTLIFNEAAKEGALIAGAHLPFPGVGHVLIDGKGYEWIPVNYTVIH